MIRREFMTLIGGAAVAWPLAAQQPGKILAYRLSIGSSAPGIFGGQSMGGGFLQGMRELGLIEDKDFIVEWRFAEVSN